ncbi:MAG: YaiI/YqxD family protein [Bdellovibrionota bacterium]
MTQNKSSENDTIRIFVDADSCPVKDEVYKIVYRHQVPAYVISNSFMRVPEGRLIKLVLVSSDFDAADNYIAERASSGTIVVTADILLADRCIKAKATVINPNGTLFTENSIGAAVATRAIMEDLRAGGEQLGGKAPFSKADKGRFLSALHDAVIKLRRKT